MPGGSLLLIGVMVLGIIARSPLTFFSAAAILLFHHIGWSSALDWLERRGVESGLMLLMLAMLAPFASEKINSKDILSAFFTGPGILALLGGLIATHLNGRGIDLLQADPQLIVGMIVGSLLGIFFFGGVPVGPLMAGGLTALFLQVYWWIFK